MSARKPTKLAAARAARGFTLIELLVTVAIALFLIDGLVTILQNIRSAYNNQFALSQLQDQQRFAMTVLTDVIQAGGYFPDPVAWQPSNALPAGGAFVAGQAFAGTHAAGVPDSITVRYRTSLNDGVLLCNGATNTGLGPTHMYLNAFTVVPPAGAVPGQLFCQLDAAAPVAIVSGIQNLLIYYGVKRNPIPADYNVDTYLTADQMNVAGPNGNDWNNVSSVRIILTFTNPLATQPGQPATINFERVVEVMARAGLHT